MIVKSIRVVIRSILFLLFTAFIYVAANLQKIILLKFPKLRAKTSRLAFKTWSEGLIKILGGKIEVKNWPIKENTLFISNHISYLDIIILNSVYPFAFVAKSEIAKWPIIGSLTRSVDTIFLDRNNPFAIKKLSKKIDDKINKGDSVLIFPEGTTSNGEEILEFKKAIFIAILRAKAHKNLLGCISLKYEIDEKYGNVKNDIAWWGDMVLFPHLIKLFGIPKWKVIINCEEFHFDEKAKSSLIVEECREVVENSFNNS